jgi:DNA-binding MarR family transcriptional regulator
MRDEFMHKPEVSSALIGERTATAGIPLEAIVEIKPAQGGISDHASSHLVGLWIDLVNQAGSSQPQPHMVASSGLSREQLRALDCLQDHPLTMKDLARCLGITLAAAKSTSEILIDAGAVEIYLDAVDEAVLQVVATEDGVRISNEHRATQVAALETLLDQAEPSRRAVLALAMQDLAASTEPTWSDSPTGPPTLELEPWSITEPSP